MQRLRRLGIAFGSLVAAWLSVSLVASLFMGQAASRNGVVSLIAIVLGWYVYRDILRRGI